MASVIDGTGCIENNLPAQVFRKSCENKNLLFKKGSIYIGTGEKETISYDVKIQTIIMSQLTTDSTTYIGTLDDDLASAYVQGSQVFKVYYRGNTYTASVSNTAIQVTGITGGNQEISVDIVTPYTFEVYKTKSLDPPNTDGTYVLVASVNAQNQQDFTWKKLTANYSTNLFSIN